MCIPNEKIWNQMDTESVEWNIFLVTVTWTHGPVNCEVTLLHK